MAVETPQLDVPIYQPKDTAQASQQQATQPSQMLPAQAGFVSKKGAAAFVANDILNGWMRGREVAKQRELAKAQNQVQGSDYAYQTMSKNYTDMLRQGKTDADPEVQKAKQAAVAAWHQKLDVMQQYAMPEEKPKGAKGQQGSKVQQAKGHAENWLSHTFGKAGLEPHMIPQASLAILRSAEPPGLGLSPEDQKNMAQAKTAEAQTGLMQTEAKAAEAKLKYDQQKQAEDAAIQSIVKKPVGARSADEREQLAGWERMQHINDPADKKWAEEITGKLQAGQALKPDERAFAYAHKLLEGPQIQTHTNGKGMDEILTVSPDGKVLGAVSLGRHFEPDQVGPAMRLARAQQTMEADMYNRALPPVEGETADARKQRVWQMVAAEHSRSPAMAQHFLTDNPRQQEQSMDMMNKALRAMWEKAGGPGASKERKDAERQKMSNFIYPGNSDDPTNAGMFLFRPQVADPTGTKGWWFGSKEETYAGGLTGKKAIATEQAALYNQIRATLQDQNKKLTPQELDRILPPWLSGQAGPMSPQPSSQGVAVKPMGTRPDSGPIMGAPGAGKKKYSVTANGTTTPAWMTPEDAKEYANYGAQVAEIQ